ncbi:MAG: hypothetical protein K2H43_00750 [Clostridia bacterium]|nr:hypothetical protein [Clostridia bacterium]
MTKRPVKLLPVWVAISSVLIIAGIVLVALLGFNFSAERSNYKSIEVQYDVVTEISDGAVENLKSTCDGVFKTQKLSVSAFESVKEVDSNSGSETGNTVLVYTFNSGVSEQKLREAGAALIEAINAVKPENSEVSVSVHVSEGKVFTEAIWRGAVGLAVGAVVVLVYLGIRFGIGAALTGLTNCAHDVLVTLAIFAIARIPVYAFAPLLFAAVAAVVSLLLWMIQCIKMRENFKDPSYASLSAEDAVEQSSKTARKYVLGVAISFGAILVVCGGIATAGVRLFLLPALLPVAVATYSAMLFGPALHVHVKAAFDKLKSKRKARYVGKAKAEKPKED